MKTGRAPDSFTGGTLDRVPLPEVLRPVFVDRSTGKLVLTRLGEERTFWFDRGQLASASSNREAQEVGALLRTFGLADEAILLNAFEKALTEPGKGLAKALHETGAVPPFVADACVRALAERVFFDTFRWTSGAFTFSALDALPDLPVRIGMTNGSLILEALRRLPADAPRPGRKIKPDARPAITADLVLRYQVVTLLKEEFDVIARIDGFRQASEVAEDPAVLERLAATGLVEIRPSVAAADPNEPEQRVSFPLLNIEVAGAPPSPRNAEALERQIGTIWNTYRRVDWATFYDILGIAQTAGEDEVELALQERARLFHPDNAVHPALREGRDALEILFQKVRDAARTFRSADAREDYDATLSTGGQNLPMDASGPMPDVQLEIAKKNYLRARQLVEEEDYHPALEMIRQSVEFDGTRPEYWILLARILKKNHRWVRQGTEALRRAVAKIPESVDLWYELSEMCALERNEPERVKALKEILRIDPANRRAQQALAEIASMKPGKGR